MKQHWNSSKTTQEAENILHVHANKLIQMPIYEGGLDFSLTISKEALVFSWTLSSHLYFLRDFHTYYWLFSGFLSRPTVGIRAVWNREATEEYGQRLTWYSPQTTWCDWLWWSLYDLGHTCSFVGLSWACNNNSSHHKTTTTEGQHLWNPQVIEAHISFKLQSPKDRLPSFGLFGHTLLLSLFWDAL